MRTSVVKVDGYIECAAVGQVIQFAIGSVIGEIGFAEAVLLHGDFLPLGQILDIFLGNGEVHDLLSGIELVGHFVPVLVLIDGQPAFEGVAFMDGVGVGVIGGIELLLNALAVFLAALDPGAIHWDGAQNNRNSINVVICRDTECAAHGIEMDTGIIVFIPTGPVGLENNIVRNGAGQSLFGGDGAFQEGQFVIFGIAGIFNAFINIPAVEGFGAVADVRNSEIRKVMIISNTPGRFSHIITDVNVGHVQIKGAAVALKIHGEHFPARFKEYIFGNGGGEHGGGIQNNEFAVRILFRYPPFIDGIPGGDCPTLEIGEVLFVMPYLDTQIGKGLASLHRESCLSGVAAGFAIAQGRRGDIKRSAHDCVNGDRVSGGKAGFQQEGREFADLNRNHAVRYGGVQVFGGAVCLQVDNADCVAFVQLCGGGDQQRSFVTAITGDADIVECVGGAIFLQQLVIDRAAERVLGNRESGVVTHGGIADRNTGGFVDHTNIVIVGAQVGVTDVVIIINIGVGICGGIAVGINSVDAG